MTSFTMKLAGIPLQVEAIFPSTKKFCEAYLSDEAPAFTITIAEADIMFEREKSAAEDALEGIPERYFPDAYLETLAVYRKIAVTLIDYGVLLFHGSVVAVGDTAFLFTATSGTGKTTHTNLWLKKIPGAYVVNGDKPLLKVTETGVIACGTPWQGKENYGRNINVPLKAICVLERDTCNHIEPITAKEALSSLFQQTYRPRDPAAMLKTMKLIGALGERVALYRLGCNMDEAAAVVAYEGMK